MRWGGDAPRKPKTQSLKSHWPTLHFISPKFCFTHGISEAKPLFSFKIFHYLLIGRKSDIARMICMLFLEIC